MKGNEKDQRHTARIDGPQQIEIEADQIVGAVMHDQFEASREGEDVG